MHILVSSVAYNLGMLLTYLGGQRRRSAVKSILALRPFARPLAAVCRTHGLRSPATSATVMDR